MCTSSFSLSYADAYRVVIRHHFPDAHVPVHPLQHPARSHGQEVQHDSVVLVWRSSIGEIQYSVEVDGFRVLVGEELGEGVRRVVHVAAVVAVGAKTRVSRAETRPEKSRHDGDEP